MRLIRQIPKPTANQPTIRRPIHKTQHKLDATLKLTEDLREMSSSYAHMDLGQLEEIQAAAILAANRITLAAKKVELKKKLEVTLKRVKDLKEDLKDECGWYERLPLYSMQEQLKEQFEEYKVVRKALVI